VVLFSLSSTGLRLGDHGPKWPRQLERAPLARVRTPGSGEQSPTGINMAISSKCADLASIVAVIEHSQIAITGVSVCPARLCRRFDLPAGFEAVDVAVLDWIVVEEFRATRVVLM
jgi:hypothetical protein